MEIPVVVELVENNAFRARSGEPLVLEAQGATAEEAVNKFKELLAARIAAGTRVVAVEVPCTSEDPWLKLAGIHDPNDPIVQLWMECMAENRRKEDAEPDPE